MSDLVPYGSREYCALLLLLAIARGADFLSTWTATPRLVLEANPIGRGLGWKGSLILNVALVLVVAAWPIPAVTITTASVLVAARNFQFAWLSRSMGEKAYQAWLGKQLAASPKGLYFLCLGAHAGLFAALGVALIAWSLPERALFGMGLGFIAYAIIVPLFTFVGIRRVLRMRSRSDIISPLP
ncbi:MAG: hypothetical protein J7M29_09345 [Verrucomicrobia bacterium]|nr:hypothetical protein [Verrucomicrobiota bacterium]